MLHIYILCHKIVYWFNLLFILRRKTMLYLTVVMYYLIVLCAILLLVYHIRFFPKGIPYSIVSVYRYAGPRRITTTCLLPEVRTRCTWRARTRAGQWSSGTWPLVEPGPYWKTNSVTRLYSVRSPSLSLRALAFPYCHSSVVVFLIRDQLCFPYSSNI